MHLIWAANWYGGDGSVIVGQKDCLESQQPQNPCAAGCRSKHVVAKGNHPG